MTATLTQTASAPAAVPTSATAWQIDPAHTQVEFAVRHLMISTVHGRFSDLRGALTVSDGDFSHGRLEASIHVGSLDTREPKRDAHLKSADFFDVDKFPTLTFMSRRIEADAKDSAHFTLVGDLTLHGVTREVTLGVVAEGRGRDPWGNDRAGFSATGSISRKDFGLLWNRPVEGGVLVSDDVTITLDVELVEQEQS